MEVRVAGDAGQRWAVASAAGADEVGASQLRNARARLRDHLAGLAVVVGVQFDLGLQRAVIVVREVSTGRVIQQIPPDTPIARFADIREQVAAAVRGKGGRSG